MEADSQHTRQGVEFEKKCENIICKEYIYFHGTETAARLVDLIFHSSTFVAAAAVGTVAASIKLSGDVYPSIKLSGDVYPSITYTFFSRKKSKKSH